MKNREAQGLLLDDTARKNNFYPSLSFRQGSRRSNVHESFLRPHETLQLLYPQRIHDSEKLSLLFLLKGS